MSGSMHLYHHLGLDAQSLDQIAAAITDRLRPLIEAIPQTNADAIATAVARVLEVQFNRLDEEILTMSGTLHQQIADEVARINADNERIANGIDNVKSDIDALASRLNPGDPVTAEDIAALRAAVDNLGNVTDNHAGVVDALNNLAQPAPAPEPPPTPTP